MTKVRSFPYTTCWVRQLFVPSQPGSVAGCQRASWLETVHVIPEMLGSQLRRRSRGPNARQGRAGNPIPHRLFADRFASAVDRGQTDVITGAQPLGALRA